LRLPRVLVSGATGFIGTELLKNRDRTDRWDVRTVDSPPAILSHGAWGQECVYIHLAGKFSGSTDVLWAANVTLLRDCLKALRAIGGRRIIFLSTGAVYGGTLHSTGSREEDPTAPCTYYGFTKLVAELLIQHEWAAASGSYLIMRLPNVYGSEQKKGVLFDISRQIRQGESIRITGDGEQRRDFLHVSDLIRAIESGVENSEVSGCFNISSHLTLTVNQVADILSNGKAISRTYVKDDNGLRSLVLDITKARSALGYEPMQNSLLW